MELRGTVKHCILGLISVRMYSAAITSTATGVNPYTHTHTHTHTHMQRFKDIWILKGDTVYAYTPIYVCVCACVCVFKSMTQPCKHQLLSGLYALPKPQLGELAEQKRPLGPTGVGFLPLESISQVQIDGE